MSTEIKQPEIKFTLGEVTVNKDGVAKVVAGGKGWIENCGLSDTEINRIRAYDKHYVKSATTVAQDNAVKLMLADSDITEVRTQFQYGANPYGKTIIRNEREVSSRNPKTGEEKVAPRTSVKILTGTLPVSDVKKASIELQEALAKG